MGSEDLELGVHSAPDEDIAGKQWQRDVLGSVLPPVGGGVEWEKHFMALLKGTGQPVSRVDAACKVHAADAHRREFELPVYFSPKACSSAL
jgi:hypothetical protein